MTLLTSRSLRFNQWITLEYLRKFLHTKYAPSNCLRNHKIIFYLKFLNIRVKTGQNEGKIDNTKIIINLLAELKLRLKR